MMLEHALLRIKDGQEKAFEESMAQALVFIESAPDCQGAEVRRQEEDPSRYLLLVRWTSVEAHMAFRETDLYEQWRLLTHHFYADPISVTHFHDPLSS
jgi:heme-degrading monooxygenase HmoA